MKLISKIIPFLFVLFSCSKQNNYHPFSDKELSFVSYSSGQTIRFVDTNNIVHTLTQKAFKREYHEFIGIYGSTGDFHESFSVQYSSSIDPDLGFFIGLNGKFYPYTLGNLNINFSNFIVDELVDSLNSLSAAISIAGNAYSNVYSLKAYKNGRTFTNIDTATIFYNRQYGIIQLLLPNGKSCTRVN